MPGSVTRLRLGGVRVRAEIPELFGQLEAAAGGRYRWIASTEAQDSYGRVIRVAGWDLTDFEKNPVMLWDHGMSAALEREPIGHVPVIAADTYQGKPALIAETTPASVLSPVAERLWKQVDAGVLRAVSIGAQATKSPKVHDDFVEYAGQKLTELSLVAVGANPDALRIAASAFGSEFTDVFGPLVAFQIGRRADPRPNEPPDAWRERQRLVTH